MEINLFENLTTKLLMGGVVDVTLSDGTVVTAAHNKTAPILVPVTAKFLDALKSAGLSASASVGSNLEVMLTIGFPGERGVASNDGYLDACIVNHEDNLTCNGTVAKGDIQLSVTIGFVKETIPHREETRVRCFVPADSTYSFPLISPEGLAKSRFKISTEVNGQVWDPIFWTRPRIYNGHPATWDVVCSAKLIFPTFHCRARSVSGDLVVLNRMLTEELYCDVVVIPGNNSEVKFHWCVMTARSSVFNSMFQSGMEEARTGIVQLPHMTEEGVRALREYLYIGKLTVPVENPQVCWELFEAGHKYHIEPLEKSVERILLRKPHDWYSVDVALRLFLFVRGRGEEGLELKTKVVRVLKAKYDELEALPSYQKLFKKNTDAAMDLCKCFAKLHVN